MILVHSPRIVLWPAPPRLPRKFGLRRKGPTWTWRDCPECGVGHGFLDHKPSFWDRQS